MTSAVNVGLDNCASIFYDSKPQKVIADAVMQEIRKQLNKRNLRKQQAAGNGSLLLFFMFYPSHTQVVPPLVFQYLSKAFRAGIP